jgi:hypothetical protein
MDTTHTFRSISMSVAFKAKHAKEMDALGEPTPHRQALATGVLVNA